MSGSSHEERFLRPGNPIVWTLLATIVFFVILVFFGLAETCNSDLFPAGNCPPKWKHLYVAPPNEVGDTLAGLAGVLAFIWLIGTVLLQSIELREQRKEFREQREATQDMARAIELQTGILVKQNDRADAMQAGQIAEEKIEELRCKIMEMAVKPLSLIVADGSVRSFSIIEMMQPKLTSGHKMSSQPIGKLLDACSLVHEHVEAIRSEYPNAKVPRELIAVRTELENVLSWLDKADAGTKTRNFKHNFQTTFEHMKTGWGNTQ